MLKEMDKDLNSVVIAVKLQVGVWKEQVGFVIDMSIWQSRGLLTLTTFGSSTPSPAVLPH